MDTTRKHGAENNRATGRAESGCPRQQIGAPVRACVFFSFYRIVPVGAFLIIFAMVILIEMCPAMAQSHSASNFQPTTHINGTLRLPDLDVIELKDGGRLRGRIVNESFMLHTAYGPVSCEIGWLSGIEFDRTPSHVDRVLTINRNRLSGFLNEVIEFRKASGETIQLDKVALQRIVFGQRETESAHGSTGRFLVLKNGDLLSGDLRNWNVDIGSGAGVVDREIQEIESVRFVNGRQGLQILLRNGREETGKMTEDFFQLTLDLGSEIQMPVAHVQTLFVRRGTLPIPVRREFGESHSAEKEFASVPPGPDPEGMVWIKPGRFQMGSDPAEKGHGTDEDPPTEMIVSRGFWMGRHEVTQTEYAAIIGRNPSGFIETNHPVEKVTWNEANAYCEALSAREREAGRLLPGYVYRLPTEAEWEYACRAGTTTRFGFGDDFDETELGAYAWFISNSSSSTRPVGQLKPNAWGLYDMHGNVWEWCQDLWLDAYPSGTVTDYTGPGDGWLRVARGGSWLYDATFCRSANRDNYGPNNRCSDIGFRVVLGPPL